MLGSLRPIYVFKKQLRDKTLFYIKRKRIKDINIHISNYGKDYTRKATRILPEMESIAYGGVAFELKEVQNQI